MANNERLNELLKAVQFTRSEREELESALASCRQASRTYALELIFEYNYTLQKCASLTGHMRPTLRIWVEAEAARRNKLGMAVPDNI